MRLYRGQIPTICEEIAKALVEQQLVEIDPQRRPEVLLDIEAVVKEYMRLQRDINEKAKDHVASRNLDYSQVSKVRQQLSEQRGMGVGDRSMDWLLNQLVEVMLHSKNVEEVFGQDHELRRVMRDVLRKFGDTDKELDRQVRARIKNLQEGTTTWEVEYERVMGEVRDRQRLD